jgi:adenylate cyclase class IV
MMETEKRTGLTLDRATTLKVNLDSKYTRKSVVNRTVSVKVDNDDFSPNPDALVDIKTKLIGESTLLSVKYGSWHSDTAREEYEVDFRREDLGAMFAVLKLLGYSKFITLTTVRTTWIAAGVVITLDEYHQIGQALFEVELEAADSVDEHLIDDVFVAVGLVPMNSEQTVEFIASLNTAKEIQVSFDDVEPDNFARELIEGHA